MKERVKKFFGVEEDKYIFEWNDVTTVLTVLNVALVVMGYAWAPWVGIVNSSISLLLNVKYKTHINLYVMQIALIILNAYFLGL